MSLDVAERPAPWLKAGFLFAMKKVLFSCLLLASAMLCRAADTKPVEEVFSRYWNALAKGDYARAAAEILPSDLEEAKAALLPVFVAAQTKQDAELQEMVKVFFGRTVGKARETLPAAEVFAGLGRLMAAQDPELAEAMKQAKMEIIIARIAGEEAEVHYHLTLPGGANNVDVDALVRKNGRWWMRSLDEAKAIAEQIKARLAK